VSLLSGTVNHPDASSNGGVKRRVPVSGNAEGPESLDKVLFERDSDDPWVASREAASLSAKRYGGGEVPERRDSAL
jgi:hypothetical protein